MKRLLYLLSTVVVSLSVLGSCEKNAGDDNQSGESALQTPQLKIAAQTSESFTLTWNIVDNALYYVYRVNGGEESSTSQPNVSFSGLETGTYVVEVKARPAPNSGWNDSEWASVTVELVLEEDWFLIDDVYLKDDDMYNYYKYNSVYFLFTGHDVLSVKMNVLKSSEVSALSDEELEEKLIMNMTQEGIDLLNSTGSLEGAMTNLEPETEYVVVAMAVHENGTEKLIKSEPISTEPVPEMPEGLEDWIGSYKVTSTQTLEIYAEQDQSVGYKLHETPVEFTIDIEPSPNDVKTLYIYGWSILEEQLGTRLPAMAQLSGDGGLSMIQGYVNYGSSSLTWMPVCMREDNTISILTICDVIFTMYDNDGRISVEMYSGNSGGYDFRAIATDLFIMGGTSVQIPHAVPAYMPAGEFTMEKLPEGSGSPKLFVPGLTRQ